MTTRSPDRDPLVLAVDRPALGRVAEDEVEDRVQVRLLRRELDALAGERDRRLEQPAPGERPVALVRRLQPGDDAGNGARAFSDEIDLRRRAVEVDVDRLHVRLRRLARALSGQRDEEVEQPIAPVARAVHEQKAAGRRPGQRALGDPGGEGRREAGVDGVSALLEDLGARLGGQPVPCCDRASHRAKRRATLSLEARVVFSPT